MYGDVLRLNMNVRDMVSSETVFGLAYQHDFDSLFSVDLFGVLWESLLDQDIAVLN